MQTSQLIPCRFIGCRPHNSWGVQIRLRIREVRELFKRLPVRHKEFMRNCKSQVTRRWEMIWPPCLGAHQDFQLHLFIGKFLHWIFFFTQTFCLLGGWIFFKKSFGDFWSLESSPIGLFLPSLRQQYCWWKKSQTSTWHVWNLVNNRDIYHINWCTIFSINSMVR